MSSPRRRWHSTAATTLTVGVHKVLAGWNDLAATRNLAAASETEVKAEVKAKVEAQPQAPAAVVVTKYHVIP